jgi:hypothetical protein
MPSKRVVLAPITTGMIADGAITTAKLADGCLSADAAGRAKMANGFIVTAKIGDAQITTAKLADGVLSADAAGRAKMADGFLTAAKCASGVMSSRITADHTSTSYTLGAGAEASIVSISGNGHADILFAGDGDGVFNMRVYIDGTLEESFPTNEARVGTYSFTTSIEIRVQNPTGSSATQTSSSFNLRGVSR